MISLDGVTKQYASDVTIGPVTAQIPPGGITALVGPNGAGKSTMLTMIGRLLGIDEGAIEVAGYDVTRTKSKDLARILSILRQENHFVTRLTVRQLVGFGRFPHSGGRLTEHDERIIDDAIDFLDLSDLEGRYLDELSGGQRQLVALASVLTVEPSVLLMDEPTTLLDLTNRTLLRDTLDELVESRGVQIITTTHDLEFAADAERVLVIDDGQIAFDGPADQAIAHYREAAVSAARGTRRPSRDSGTPHNPSPHSAD